MLKPPPEPEPDHREQCNSKGRFDQQRFLEREDVDDAVTHIKLLTGANIAEYSTTKLP